MSDRELHCCAATDANCRGRQHAEPDPSYRSQYQRDRDRIVHSAAFRRLEYKTQVFVNHEGDLFRTRLTHSIEVAQIARSVARALRLNEDLVEAISLAHDLGHTPFGHAGQDALNACMKDYGGFEHNLQSLRVVDVLEERYADFPGLNLTFESREGILKHCSLANARLLGDIGERFLNKQQPSLEAQLANLADEIAYNNHDVDDGLRYGLITIEQLREVALFDRHYREVNERYPQISSRRMVHEIIRRMINHVVVDLVETSKQRISQSGANSIDDVRSAPGPLMAFSDEVREEMTVLKRFLRANLYNHFRVRRMTQKSVGVIEQLFAAFFEDPKIMPPQYQEALHRETPGRAAESGAVQRARVVADYIAGMTDRYAIREYQRVFDPSADS
ncbi:MAG: deoxyguanosinetriphosphate triphosphohydrolase [Gammaproteobacteria bacterium]|nr:deoxyguanosinetriphosphate triphosphohydrolase [Gammaproteobacteria bacterium]